MRGGGCLRPAARPCAPGPATILCTTAARHYSTGELAAPPPGAASYAQRSQLLLPLAPGRTADEVLALLDDEEVGLPFTARCKGCMAGPCSCSITVSSYFSAQRKKHFLSG